LLYLPYGTRCIDSVRTSQETHYVSATKSNRLMLFRETVAVYCENRMEHTNTLLEQNAEFMALKQVVHWTLNGEFVLFLPHNKVINCRNL
jgi:hypothetical protein